MLINFYLALKQISGLNINCATNNDKQSPATLWGRTTYNMLYTVSSRWTPLNLKAETFSQIFHVFFSHVGWTTGETAGPSHAITCRVVGEQVAHSLQSGPGGECCAAVCHPTWGHCAGAGSWPRSGSTVCSQTAHGPHRPPYRGGLLRVHAPGEVERVEQTSQIQVYLIHVGCYCYEECLWKRVKAHSFVVASSALLKQTHCKPLKRKCTISEKIRTLATYFVTSPASELPELSVS